MINIDIAYYENMLSIVSENQKINEVIMAPRFMKYFTESQEEISIYENKVTDSILNFFKMIFDKVAEFFKKIINAISDLKNFTPDKKLISNVENKLKSMTKEEKDKFSAEIVLHLIDKNDPYLDALLEQSEKCVSNLEEIVYTIKDLMYKDMNTEGLDKEIKLYDTELPAPMIIHTATINYYGLKEVISQYENMYPRVKTLRSRLQADQIAMNNYRKTIESLVKKNDIETNNDILNKYKEVTIKICDLLMKVNSEIIKEMLYSFNQYKKVLLALSNEN